MKLIGSPCYYGNNLLRDFSLGSVAIQFASSSCNVDRQQ